MRPCKGLLIFICLAFLPGSPASARLGERASSIPKTASTKASAPSQESGPFTVHEFVQRGVTVREYVGPDNLVFAVAWNGMHEPTGLEDLLGSYYGDFSNAADKAKDEKPTAFRTPSVVKGSQITVVRSGHMRAIRGKAYLTDQLPDGVRPEDLE